MAFGLLKSPKCIYMSKMPLHLKNVFIQNINDENKSFPYGQGRVSEGNSK